MEKHYVGSEIGQLRSVMLAPPKFKSETFNAIELPGAAIRWCALGWAAGEEHDIFANTLREQGVEVLLLTDLLTQTLDIAEAKTWLLETQISDYRLGANLCRRRARLAGRYATPRTGTQIKRRINLRWNSGGL